MFRFAQNGVTCVRELCDTLGVKVDQAQHLGQVVSCPTFWGDVKKFIETDVFRTEAVTVALLQLERVSKSLPTQALLLPTEELSPVPMFCVPVPITNRLGEREEWSTAVFLSKQGLLRGAFFQLSKNGDEMRHTDAIKGLIYQRAMCGFCSPTFDLITHRRGSGCN